MAKTGSFDFHSEAYEEWFVKNPLIYADEVQTLKRLVGKRTNGLDIGMGSGRFAIPLGIYVGVEPSQQMREIATDKGLHPIDGTAESLPFADESFDFAIMITVICFVDDPLNALQEAFRVIRRGGTLIVGMIDKDSILGQTYTEHKPESRFYREATFYSIPEITSAATRAGFDSCSTTRVKATNDSFVFIECFKS